MSLSPDTAVDPAGATEANYTFSGSGLNTQSVDSQHLLQALSDREAALLLPAILITVILMIVGLLGNPLALYIYGWRWQSSTTRVFLVCLAVVDLMNCLITIPTEIIIMREFYHFPSDWLCKVSRFTTYVMNNATVVIFMAIAVDRYIRICHPHRKPMSLRGAKIVCVVGMVVGFLVGWPALILYGKIEMPVRDNFNTTTVTGAMCLVHNNMEGYTLAFVSYLCSAFFVCALILIVFYTLIGRTILKRKRLQRLRKEATAAALENMGGRIDANDHTESPRISRLQHTNGNTSHDTPPTNFQTNMLTPDEESTRGCNVNHFSFRKCRKLRPPRATLMLFLITVVYIVSFLPFLIISIIRQHRGAEFYSTLTGTEQVCFNIFQRSYLVNNCSNPVVYGLCNSQFRNECKILYRRLFRKTGGPPSTDSLKSKTVCETPRQERRQERQTLERQVLERQALERLRLKERNSQAHDKNPHYEEL